MNTVAEQHADSVGAILRQSREAKGLTTAQVAKQLNLKVSVIEQIEAEQWDPAVSMTFMRGYLRAYARLMKLSEREILQTFELQAAYLRSQPRPMHSFSKKTSLDAAENRFMLATYLLIVLLIGLFLIWFWQTHLLDDTPVSVVPAYQVPIPATTDSHLTSQSALPTSVATTPDVVAASENKVAEATTPAAETPDVAQSQSPIASTTATSTTATSTTAAAITAETAADAALPEPKPATELQALRNSSTSTSLTGETTTEATVPEAVLPVQQSPAPATTAMDSPVLNEAASTVPGAAAALSGNEGRLQLAFSADCWLEVYDQNNQRLAYGTQAAGKQLVLQGTLPFRLKLGNPPAASMKLNDVVVDLSGYPAGRVARITLTGQL